MNVPSGIHGLARYSLRTLAIISLSTAPALAQNLVTNGGFETGTFSGFTTGGCQDHTYVGSGGAHSGTYYGSFGQEGSCFGTFSQTLATTVGQVYNISFYVLNNGDTADNRFRVYFGGTTVFDQAITNGTYQLFSAVATATSASTNFSFAVYNNPAYTHVDDISVTLASSSVPEPSSVALLGTGLVGLVPILRRRRSA